MFTSILDGLGTLGGLQPYFKNRKRPNFAFLALFLVKKMAKKWPRMVIFFFIKKKMTIFGKLQLKMTIFGKLHKKMTIFGKLQKKMTIFLVIYHKLKKCRFLKVWKTGLRAFIWAYKGIKHSIVFCRGVLTPCQTRQRPLAWIFEPQLSAKKWPKMIISIVICQKWSFSIVIGQKWSFSSLFSSLYIYIKGNI